MTEPKPTEQMTERHELEAQHELNERNERKARRARDNEMSQPDANVKVELKQTGYIGVDTNVLLNDPDTGFSDIRMTNRHWDDNKKKEFPQGFIVADQDTGELKRVNGVPQWDERAFGVISIDHSTPSAHSIIGQAKKEMTEREEAYDAPGGERSMTKTVAAFNAIHGLGMTEVQGWQFMELLKIVRSSQGKFKADNFVDGAAYAALAGEAAGKL